MESVQRTRLASILILVVVFGAGMVVGVAIDRTLMDTPVARAPAADTVADDDREDRERRRQLYEQVDGLTDEQLDSIESVVADYREAGRGLWSEQREEVEPLRRKWEHRFDSLVETTRTSIKSFMTAEQAEQYDSLIAEWEEKRRDDRRRDRDSDDDGGD